MIEKMNSFFRSMYKMALGLLAGTAVMNSTLALPPAQAKGMITPPNIILFLVDDLGWTDINCKEGADKNGDPITYTNSGGESDSSYYYTPNLAKLRNEGIRFTNAYAACPFCAPTRASLLTGKYPARLGFTHNADRTQEDDGNRTTFPFAGHMTFREPEHVNYLDPAKETLIPKALDAGSSDYLSASIGKWHLYKSGVTGGDPDSHGFDYNIGGSYRQSPLESPDGSNFYRGGSWNNGYFPNLEAPNVVYDGSDGKPKWDIGDDNDADFRTEGYLTDALTHRALEFIDMSQNSNGKPFFLYMSHYAVHVPIQPPTTTNTFDPTGRADPRHDSSSTYSLNYAKMIKSVDESLGMIMENVPDNTIIIFYSDNGGELRNEITSNKPLRRGKVHPYEGGTRVPLIVWEHNVPDINIIQNTTCDVPVTTPDIFPTILDMAGITLADVEAASTNGFDPDTIDGTSIVPLLDGDSNTTFDRNGNDNPNDDAIFWHLPHYMRNVPFSSVIMGDHKFLRFWEDQDNIDTYINIPDFWGDRYTHGDMKVKELYDLSTNIEEDRNVYDQSSALAKSMERTLDKWLISVGAKMPTAAKGKNQNGADERWYSKWDGDVDGNGFVNMRDLLVLAENWLWP